MKEKILILTPLRNEEDILPLYLESLNALSYPEELIDVYWLENDSSDDTLGMLRQAKHRYSRPFNSITLKAAKIYGSVKKQPRGLYFKDIPYGLLRFISWVVIWNKYFITVAEESKADYVLVWFADALAPKNVITEYLKVFKQKKDAGWVGGSICRRHPIERKRKRLITTVRSPRPIELAYSKEIIEVDYTAHVWMMPRQALVNSRFSWNGVTRGEVHKILINNILKQDLKVYYQPSIYLQHVSSDGIVHNPTLPKELW